MGNNGFGRPIPSLSLQKFEKKTRRNFSTKRKRSSTNFHENPLRKCNKYTIELFDPWACNTAIYDDDIKFKRNAMKTALTNDTIKSA